MTPDSPPPITLSMSKGRRACRPLSVPVFCPVPTRTRRDGWTVERQADFLGMLAETGSVIGACEAVGISRKSAYQLRARPGAGSFAAAWDLALGGPVRKVTPLPENCRPPVHLVMFRGRYRGAWRNATDGALLSHVWPHRPGDRCIPDGDSPEPRWSRPGPRFRGDDERGRAAIVGGQHALTGGEKP